MTDTSVQPPHDPNTYLESIVASGYHIVFRVGDEQVRATSPEHVAEHYPRSDGHALHRSHHVFVRPATLGAAFVETAGGARVELEGLSFELGGLEPVHDGRGALYGEIVDGGCDAYTAVMHPTVPADDDGRAIAFVHGFHFHRHIGWFCRPKSGQTPSTTLADPPANFPNVNQSTLGTAPRIGLIDNGVDLSHSWMKALTNSPGSVGGDPCGGPRRSRQGARDRRREPR